MESEPKNRRERDRRFVKQEEERRKRSLAYEELVGGFAEVVGNDADVFDVLHVLPKKRSGKEEKKKKQQEGDGEASKKEMNKKQEARLVFVIFPCSSALFSLPSL